MRTTDNHREWLRDQIDLALDAAEHNEHVSDVYPFVVGWLLREAGLKRQANLVARLDELVTKKGRSR